MRICGTRQRLEGEARSIPHLAKNERDMGHPTSVAGIEPKSAFIAHLTATGKLLARDGKGKVA
jgi:hypothetical protein